MQENIMSRKNFRWMRVRGLTLKVKNFFKSGPHYVRTLWYIDAKQEVAEVVPHCKNGDKSIR